TAQPRSSLGNNIEYRLDVRRRAGDDSKNFTRGCLLVQRFLELHVRYFKFVGFTLEFVEQAGILNGDGCLVRESLEQGHVRLRKWSQIGMPNRNRTDRIAPS